MLYIIMIQSSLVFIESHKGGISFIQKELSSKFYPQISQEKEC